MSTAANRQDDTPVIAVESLGLRSAGQWLLREIDLALARGETLALIGESGGGKTMLLRRIIGLRRPDAGRVRVFGQALHALDPDGVRAISRRWGVLFQHGALFSALSVYDNIAFPMRELRKDGAHVDEAMIADLVPMKLAMVGLDADVAAKSPAQLSGGMIKRAALARALALDAELLFLDEPTAGLDPASAGEFDALYRSLQTELGLSGLIITHDLDTLSALADRVAVLADGGLLTTGTLDEVANTDHPFIRRFFAPRQRANDA